MENDILDALEDLGYSGELLLEGKLSLALEGGPKSVQYTELVEWICKELKILCNLDETVNAIATEEDTSNFLIEISSFLKELGCVYTTLIEGHLSDRLGTKENCMLLLEYLLSELMAARMIRVEKPQLNNQIELKIQESTTAADLKSLLIALKFPRPPENITSQALFSKVEDKLKDTINKAPQGLVSKPLFTDKLSDKQWHDLSLIQKNLQAEYKIRKDMLVTRLDVTIQSFQWSERVKNRENEIAEIFTSRRNKMEKDEVVDLSDLLAAREDLAVLEKTSSAAVRKNTQSEINKVIIGRVPDRGGRPSEQEAPPPEMPSWQKDRAAGGVGGGDGRGGGRGRGGGDFSRGGGGRVQGGWNQGGGGGGYDNRGGGGGSHHDNRGGGGGGSYHDNRGYDSREGGGSYHDNRGYDNRGGGGGHHDNRGGSYRDNREGGGGGGYHDNRDRRDRGERHSGRRR